MSTISKLFSFLSYYFDPVSPSGGEENPLEVDAVPGLMTFIDVALYRAVEGELTVTVLSGHALLTTFLELKRQAVLVLRELRAHGAEMGPTARSQHMESFARACMDAACDAIEKISTDKLAQSANLTDPFEPSSSSTSSNMSASSGQHVSSGLTSLQEASLDTGRRRPIQQRPCDCWESPRLHCPDYVWAEDSVINNCHRLLRNLLKHPFMANSAENTLISSVEAVSRQSRKASIERQASLLLQFLHDDVPSRLLQFRAAVEVNAVILKRLYLVKCECRAPFRAFLEGHQSLLRAPSLELVEEYYRSKDTKRRALAKEQLSSALENTNLVEALALEKRCEEYEIELAKQLFSFCELARFLEQKRDRLKAIPGVLDEDDVLDFHETLRRLKGILCRKAGIETSAGIRPLLLDLQGVRRDEEEDTQPFNPPAEDAITRRLDLFVDKLNVLARLCETRHAFRGDRQRAELDLPTSICRGCINFDGELFRCHFLDWYSMVQRQHDIVSQTNFHKLAQNISKAEMQTSLAMAPPESLEVVRQRVEKIAVDRQKRFDVLNEIIVDVCRREVFLCVKLVAPEEDRPLFLNTTSSLGIFGLALQLAGESLPIG